MTWGLERDRNGSNLSDRHIVQAFQLPWGEADLVATGLWVAGVWSPEKPHSVVDTGVDRDTGLVGDMPGHRLGRVVEDRPRLRAPQGGWDPDMEV